MRRRLELGEPRRLKSSERLLHDAIFARMKRDDPQTAAVRQESGRLGQRVSERAGLVTLKREAPPRLLELPRGHAQIQEDRARAADPVRGGGALETAEARVREGDAVAERHQTLARLRERRGIRV